MNEDNCTRLDGMNDDNCKRQAWEEWQQLHNIQYMSTVEGRNDNKMKKVMEKKSTSKSMKLFFAK